MFDQANDNNRSSTWKGKKLDPAECTGPRAAVFRLRTYRNHNLPHPRETGQASRRLFFDLLAGLDQELSDELHSAEKMKPYNCSFFVPEAEKGVYEWRVCDLMGGLMPILHRAIFRRSGPATVDLCGIPARFEGVSVSPSHHPRAAAAGWGELLSVPVSRNAAISFLSPTTFRTGGRTPNLMMSPLSILNGAAARWVFSGVDRFPAELMRQVAQAVSVQCVNLHTESVRGVGGRKNRGVVGRVEFSCDSVDDEILRAFTSVLSFLPWCGVGWATTAGMGQVKVEL